MAGKAGLKAGLIGVAALVLLMAINNLLPLTQVLIYVMCGVSTLVYVGIGILAASFLATPRAAGKGAAAGAIAGLVSAGINGVIGYIVNVIRLAYGLGMPGFDPQQMQQFAELGWDMRICLIPSVLFAIAIGAGVAAAGGAIFAAVKPD